MHGTTKLERRVPESTSVSRDTFPTSATVITQQLSVRGKFLYLGNTKYWIKGVTYGTFQPASDGENFPTPQVVENDFAKMRKHGINTFRTYTRPPLRVLETARRYGLRVMVGLPWEQHITFLDDPGRARTIETRVREDVRACARHPSVLCYAIGNEIPASIVRWHGRRRVQAFIERLYEAVKDEDPRATVTYVNYPSTEYLALPFLDFVCFNVYLESRDRFEAYLARLQNLADERPLVLAEVGTDSRRGGEIKQATSLDWQLRATFDTGCAGAFVFAWTDEWYRGGHAVEDWNFGLTDRARQSKPALATVRKTLAEMPFSATEIWPRISVVVCSCSGAQTIRDTFEALERLDYPDYEIILVDDGSKDATADIAAEFDVRIIKTPNRGLSNARNTGWQAADGEIVAYIDDDAYPDPHWLRYLAASFRANDYVGVGGPNLAPSGDGPIADCVANAPGGPIHVLLTDRVAEHIPGCNMAFYRSALEEVGGFDPRFRTAGDDVDLCWRLQALGGTLGFHHAAIVWHHRRSSIRRYWRQQLGYGKAESLLEEKWPEHYNTAGHLTWSGRLYGKGSPTPLKLTPSRIYQGTWGTAPFQSVYEPAAGVLRSLPLMPEWYLIVLILGIFSAIGIGWSPLLYSIPAFVLTAAISFAQAGYNASQACFPDAPKSRIERLKLKVLTAFLHLLQPLARLIGRLRHGLAPWRIHGATDLALPWRRTLTIWSKTWKSPQEWLESLEAAIRKKTVLVYRGNDYESWDLQIRAGLFGGLRALAVVEEHGEGAQLFRLRIWPRCSLPSLGLTLLCLGLTAGALLDQAWGAVAVLASTSMLLVGRMGFECLAAAGKLVGAFRDIKTKMMN